MNVILLDKIARLGSLGDKVEVKAGYARNFLLPQGKAVMANAQNTKVFEERRAELEAKLKEELATAQKRADAINNLDAVKIASKAGDEGKLFGSIGAKDIAVAVTAAGVAVEKKEIRLPNGALRTLGEHKIDVQLHPEVKTVINLLVIAED